jgi:hypothetical protein
MSESTVQTVRLSRGAHASPARGACVMELASMLAGERFNDHPRSVCPVIGGFLRSYNDLLPPAELQQLYPIAARVVGSASAQGVRRRRARRLREWARATDPAGAAHLITRFESRERIVVAAARAAVCMDPELRRSTVAELVGELVAMRDIPRVATGTPALAEAAPGRGHTAPCEVEPQHGDAVRS